MKRLFSICALMFMVTLLPFDADARKFGGGKSFGKSYKTAPAPKNQPTNTNQLSGKNDAASAAKSSSKKGLMGGLLGGLLAGGLLAAMFGSGAFEGFQIMDFLIIALVAFVLFKLFKMFMASKNGALNQGNKQAYAGGQHGASKGYYHQSSPNEASSNQFRQNASPQFGNPNQTQGFGAPVSDVPFNYPPNFDIQAFINGAREHYRILQGAWNHNELDTIQEYVSPELYNDLANERRNLSGEQHTEVMFVDAEIVRADHDQRTAHLSLQFTGRYRDQQEGVEADITDIWHLERDLVHPNAPWLIVGIES